MKKHTLRTAIMLALVSTSLLTSAAMAQSSSHGPAMQGPTNSGQRGAMTKKTRVGLDGYCPVCIIAKKKWEKGDSRIASTFDGVTYYFPGKTIKDMFDASPEKYVPALNGDCIVCYEKVGKRIPGNIRHAALHNKRLYLFPSEKEKKAFRSSPREFVNTDLAAKGECIVCLAKMGKHVPGKPKYTVIHDGLRYQFPSANEANMFRKTPANFVSTVQAMQKKTMMKTGHRTSDTQVRVAGRSGCAGCEFGVHPISAPDELGLAIVGKDGRITVVEDAHSQYPNIYKSRFDGQQLVVEGTVLKTAGKVSWVRPTSLTVMN